jgi:hypothetical protein
VTQERISLGADERGRPGQREAMPYFLAVLRQLAEPDRHLQGTGAEPLREPPSPVAPYPSAFRDPILRSLAATQIDNSD